MQNSFFRFLIVGVINTCVGLSVMYLILYITNSYWVSTFTGNTIGAGVSYLLNRKFTFKSSNSVLGSLFRFMLVIGICYFISYSIGLRISSWLLESVLGLHSSYIKELAVLSGTGLYTILNYLGQRWFVFKAIPEQEATDIS
ncbi:GtrA family protein [Neobacillus terrae]|uniref:GtrA family protein n=1 Tax=Neobacillus terrae TaxID=3034837 RepID=UPI00140A9AAD|nr:GtrA family protein [Neobacillus terrae]NHM32613.1 GtrA family protein [Neobacillus terrae]